VSETRYTFLGLPVPSSLVCKFPSGQVLFDLRYGTHVMRERTHTVVPVPRKADAL
jgi:hypothetical protein